MCEPNGLRPSNSKSGVDLQFSDMSIQRLEHILLGKDSLEDDKYTSFQTDRANLSFTSLVRLGTSTIKNVINSSCVPLESLPFYNGETVEQFLSHALAVFIHGVLGQQIFSSCDVMEFDAVSFQSESVSEGSSQRDVEGTSTLLVKSETEKYHIPQDSSFQAKYRRVGNRYRRLHRIKTCPACQRQFSGVSRFPAKFVRHIRSTHIEEAEFLLSLYEKQANPSH